MKRLIALVAVTALLIGGISAVALAQETDDGQSTTPVPTREGVLGTVLDELVGAGVLTQGQADAVRNAIQERIADMPHRHFGPRGMRGAHLETAADVLNTTVEDLAAQLREGQSLADIAGAQTDELITALVADAEERIQAAADDGRITQEQADDKMAGLTERITAKVNGEAPAGGPGFGRGFGPGFRFGPPPEVDAEGADAVNA